MDLVNHVSLWSKDSSTKVGAVIVDDEKRIISMGYNGFPTGAEDEVEERNQRPLKYKWAEHGERNCIYNAARIGVQTKGTTMYVNYFPCTDCARAIIQGGIKNLYFEKIISIERGGNLKDPQWGEDFKVSLEMLLECGVNISCVKGDRAIYLFSDGFKELIGEENFDEIIDYLHKKNFDIEKLMRS
jgi:dCMP deaminase